VHNVLQHTIPESTQPTGTYKKIIHPVLKLRATPVGMPPRVMMTMASSTANHTPPRRPPPQTTVSQPSSISPESTANKFDACCIDNKSYRNLSVLREIPTRISLQNSLAAVVDPPDDDDCNISETSLLPHPTNLENLPYQSKLAAISAEIDRLKTTDDASMEKYQLPQPTDNQSALDAISAAIERMKHKWPSVSPQPAELHLPVPAAMMNDVLPDDDDGDDGNHPHDEQHQSSSLTATFNLQTQMLRTIKTLLVELIDKVDLLVAAATCPIDKVDLLVAAATCPQKSTLPSPQSVPSHPSTLTTICQTTATQPHHATPPEPQIPPWPPHHITQCNKLALVSPKISPYKRHIPAKPPFPRGRKSNLATTETKDRLRPP